MSDIQELVHGLRDKNAKNACQCLKQLGSESENTDAVYAYFDYFAEMLDDINSYIRTRGILLIAANAKWDKDYKIDEVIDVYLKHIIDDKPITSRQCIKALPVIATYKPDLINVICEALRKANPHIYKSSMQPLVSKDIQEALKTIEKL
ncbi:SufBD protein [Aminipila sp.]|uniref:SufBD protein n=1 Tax=Aminipila sp. TaxID=2060095 RepID=UPI00289D68EE|nr:SufBD protein [Aminipila sp.]